MSTEPQPVPGGQGASSPYDDAPAARPCARPAPPPPDLPPPGPYTFDLAAEAERVLHEVAPRAHAAGLELVLRLRPGLPARLHGDAADLRRLLAALLANAIHFTEKGEVVVEAAAAREPSADAADQAVLHVAVRDTGIGVGPDTRQELFDLFGRADVPPARPSGRPGHGLLTAARLAARLGGRVSLDSAPGRGSTFAFTARFARRPGGADEAPASWRDRPVLLVDDNGSSRAAFEEVLAHWGLKTTAVDGGQAGLSALRQAADAGAPFAALLLDARMPGLSGFAVAERLLKAPPPPVPLVLLVQPPYRKSDDAYCRSLGVRARVAKPLRRQELLQALAAALDGPAPAVERPAATPTPLAGLRVLLAEGHAINQRLAARLLEKRGHDVQVAHTGTEAVALLEVRAFDLALIDLALPLLSGVEVVARLRAGEKGRLPVIGLAGAPGSPADHASWVLAGFDAVLTRPLGARDLYEALERLERPPPARADAGRTPREVFDHAAALARVEGDVALFRELAQLFIADVPRLLGACDPPLAGREAERLRRAAEDLRGAVAPFAATRALAAAERLAERARQGDWEGAALALADTRGAFGGLREALTRAVGAAL
jgi:CheY-like chemotaxis protein